ncbi:non-heme ferritin-like protein [Shimwellia blattae]|uniref:Ferritin n=1 Tax=Shimwellia blattae (strain ATCC 29907 / DSM 4481 / JCM 1650 / NBRC 105725 / CDC 9005-74) TaxID=630626 RepID=I2B806_SHIBC|nr:non-heme ferritin-like protein [Shimwellia blattae]AFJ46660.1 ferritin-like protein FtnB [Shimwellia blattae DSM 4481 = NBRC 105725]GAB80240.1 ferritin B [Shimwellia blattae DSM 4481 = NBRC 105725]VDY64134.1 Ferritin-1 [Shimwellia blattae]VEC22264.1 Ferritin-1 [Shimwellia blattae]
MAVFGMVEKLNAQMNRVFYSSNLYLQLSSWCSEHSLNGTAYFLRQQAQGDVTQMMQLFDYMKESGANPVVGEIKVPGNPCDSLETLFEKALADHQGRRTALAQLFSEAEALNDTTTLHFLQGIRARLNQTGQLLKTLSDEAHNARIAGMCMAQTDKHLAGLLH